MFSGKKNPVLFLAGVDVILYKHVEMAYRQDDWSRAIHHPEELNPLAPGAMQAIGRAEAGGLLNLGGDLFRQSVTAILSHAPKPPV
jgi:hypothetical protein